MKAKVTFENENPDEIFCEIHADVSKHPNKALHFESDLLTNKPFLYELEKDLVLVQERMSKLRNELSDDDSSLSKIALVDVENKYYELKDILRKMNDRIKQIVNNPNI